jgi:hypothetical protein
VLLGLASASVACSALVEETSATRGPGAPSRGGEDGAHAGAASGTAHGERLARAVHDVDRTRELERPGWHDGCPSEMASIDGRYCVDRWEGSLVEVLPNGEERPWSAYMSIDGRGGPLARSPHVVRAVSAPGVFPQGYISEQQAVDACAHAGKRLCSRDEWQHACRGPKDTQFPYGDVRQPHKCNDDGRSPLVAEFGRGWQLGGRSSRVQHTNWNRMNSPVLNQLTGTLAHTGERSECTNAYGVYDMVGNLHEWVDDPRGTFYGGFYQDTSQHGDGCSYVTTAHVASYHDYSTGFRCCANVVK